ncbi:plasmid partitioning protein RepB [Mesorhizobium albiziae]|nr:plasmid partitioning protein RepB [Mesorhizobium albiziae]
MKPSSAKADNDVTNYAIRGASRSIMQSFEELSKSSVVDLAPELVDASFVSDRLDDDDEEFQTLVDVIRAQGQDTPILVRPHPLHPGRFQTVFGHRRLKVAQQLGRPVRAVVKAISDRDHIVAQGQENAARANLSFIERTLFAQHVLDEGHGAETAKAALAIDETTFSKMRSVSSKVPQAVILAIGAAKNVGRDRWWQLSKLFEKPGSAEQATDAIGQTGFSELQSDARFDQLFNRLSQLGKADRKVTKAATRAWSSADKAVKAKVTDTGKAFTLALGARDGAHFGAYISSHLDELYRAFRETQRNQTGD